MKFALNIHLAYGFVFNTGCKTRVEYYNCLRFGFAIIISMISLLSLKLLEIRAIMYYINNSLR